jgi:hypothetical protein
MLENFLKRMISYCLREKKRTRKKVKNRMKRAAYKIKMEVEKWVIMEMKSTQSRHLVQGLLRILEDQN